MNKLKVAVIGLGNMGKHHVRNYSEIPEVELVAVCDIQAEIVNQFTDKYKCHGYTDLDNMLDKENLDAITITASTTTHYEIAKKIINKGINVLIEKPITDSLETADELIELAKSKNVTLMVGHIERFNPAVTKLKEIIDAGKLGDVTSVIARRVGGFPNQIKDANVIIDLAVHDIDIINYLMNAEPDTITGNAGHALNSSREDYAEIFMTYGNKNGFVQVNWITPVRVRNLAVTGTNGYAEMNYITQELVLYESVYTKDVDNFGDYIIKFGNPVKHDIALDKGEPLRQEIEHFINSIKTKKTPLISGQVGRNALQHALTVLKQIEQKQLVTNKTIK